MRRAVSALLGILFISACYVFAWPTASVPYFAAIVLHLVCGLALMALLIFALWPILRDSTPIAKIGWVLIALGGVLGVVLIFTERGAWIGRCFTRTSARACWAARFWPQLGRAARVAGE